MEKRKECQNQEHTQKINSNEKTKMIIIIMITTVTSNDLYKLPSVHQKSIAWKNTNLMVGPSLQAILQFKSGESIPFGIALWHRHPSQIRW